MLSNPGMTTLSYFGTSTRSAENLRRSAVSLFNMAFGRAQRRNYWAHLTGKTNELRSLPLHAVNTRASAPSRVVSVPINRILGSESRSQDFDAAFNPCKLIQRDRWMSILVARQMGTVLPPVELIQVEKDYYVRDGHHRISVARALGQLDIEAVIVG